MAITQLTITHLGLRNLKEISDGDVVIAKNPNLCYTKNHHWKQLFKSDTQTARLENNADGADCGKSFSHFFMINIFIDFCGHITEKKEH